MSQGKYIAMSNIEYRKSLSNFEKTTVSKDLANENYIFTMSRLQTSQICLLIHAINLFNIYYLITLINILHFFLD